MNDITIVRAAIGRTVAMLAEKSVKVTQRGTQAYVQWAEDGAVDHLNIPYIPDTATPEFIRAVHGFLDHEVAHILFTNPEVTQESNRLGVGSLHGIIEDTFIERMMTGKFRGSAMNLRDAGSFFLESFTDKKLAEGADPTPILMVPAIRAWAGQTVFQDYMADKWHLIQPTVDKLGDAVDLLENISSSEDGLKVALEFKKRLIEEEPPESSDPDDSDAKGEEKGESGSTGESPSAGEEEKEEGEDKNGDDAGEDQDGKGEGSPESAEGTDDSEASDGKATTGDGEGEAAFEALMDEISDFDEALSEAISKEAAAEAAKAEYLIYSTDGDRIVTLDADKTRMSSKAVEEMQSRVDHMVGPMQKNLERLIAARSLHTWSAGHRSGRLNASSLARLTALADDRAFRRKNEARNNDVAIGLLVDCSGSMRHHNRIQTAAYAAYAMSSVLDRLRVANEVLGFKASYEGADSTASMRGEERKSGLKYARHLPLEHLIVKGFSETMNTTTRARFAALPCSGLEENVDGESVQLAASRLACRKEKRKILMVFSDGSPACPGDYAQQHNHLKKVVRDVISAGIEVIGIGIESHEVERFYPSHVVLSDVSMLPATVMNELKRLLLK